MCIRDSLKRVGEHYSLGDSGTLSIATTHTQARYFLPEPVAKLRQTYPKVNIALHQGSPDEVARMVLEAVSYTHLDVYKRQAMSR